MIKVYSIIIILIVYIYYNEIAKYVYKVVNDKHIHQIIDEYKNKYMSKISSIFNKDTLIVTNDLLRDHIYNFNNIGKNSDMTNDTNGAINIKRWCDIKQITYSYSENTYIFNFPHIYKKNIHFISDYIHIPLPLPYNQKYICMKNTL